MPSEDAYEPDDAGPRYPDARSISPAALPAALGRLTLLGDDPYLRMQATNVGLVDIFLNGLEADLLREQAEAEGTQLSAAFVATQSQMWIFATYELLRTWRQRARDTIRLIQSGGVEKRIAVLEKDLGYRHYGRLMRAEQLRRVAARPDAVEVLETDQRRIHVTFGYMNALRVALAKHEVRGVKDSVAFAPGYGRINTWCGAIDFELSADWGIYGTLNHRDIADGLRAMWDVEPNTPEELAEFDAHLKGPPQP